jgi:hypothetical protein
MRLNAFKSMDRKTGAMQGSRVMIKKKKRLQSTPRKRATDPGVEIRDFYLHL